MIRYQECCRIYINVLTYKLHFYYVSMTGVCYLRLDFESFDINALSDSAEYKDTDPKATTECQDKFTITVSF